ncbi:MAG: tetratricopeptide repeat protein [Sedimentisphaerales bacterium]|nr:tetratricopeptide repeat protein [Sedimentisphaerales bacterium]
MKSVLAEAHSVQRSRLEPIRGACFVRLGWCLLVGMVSLGTTQGQTDPNSPGAQRSTLSVGTETRGPQVSAELTRRLWESRIAIPDSNEGVEARDDLKSLIQKVRSLKFESNEVTPSFSVPAEKALHIQPGQAHSISEDQAAMPAPPIPSPMTSQAEPAGAARPVTRETLDGLLQDPEHVRDPLEVAELLFLSGHPTEAVPFYEKALTRTVRKDATTSADRAWIQFQLGNCLRETDMVRAREAYQKLITEHPESPWTELARAHGRLITWYLTARPEQLVSPTPSQ